MKNNRERLVDFRNVLYHLFPKCKDAIFELMDANSASTTSLNSVVHLSKSAFFTRQYPSITDTLTDGLEVAHKPIEGYGLLSPPYSRLYASRSPCVRLVVASNF
jgi:hypothetical protein